uniref:Uncharacterized protein n=1 Tax=Anguilla anguilla TaxID=7936 RepID=A0A0E9QQW7_ANGAN
MHLHCIHLYNTAMQVTYLAQACNSSVHTRAL